MANSKRFNRNDYDTYQAARYTNEIKIRENHRTRELRYDEFGLIQVELMIDIRNLLYEQNQLLVKIANPIMVAQDAALEKQENKPSGLPVLTFNELGVSVDKNGNPIAIKKKANSDK